MALSGPSTAAMGGQCKKTAEPIEMPFKGLTHAGSRNTERLWNRKLASLVSPVLSEMLLLLLLLQLFHSNSRVCLCTDADGTRSGEDYTLIVILAVASAVLLVAIILVGCRFILNKVSRRAGLRLCLMHRRRKIT